MRETINLPPMTQQSVEMYFGKGQSSKEGDDTYHNYKGLVEGYSYILLKKGKDWLQTNFPVIKECKKCKKAYLYCKYHKDEEINECECGNKELKTIMDWDMAWTLLKDDLPRPMFHLKKWYVSKSRELEKKILNKARISRICANFVAMISENHLTLAFLKAFLIMVTNLKTHRIPREYIKVEELERRVPFRRPIGGLPDDFTRADHRE